MNNKKIKIKKIVREALLAFELRASCLKSGWPPNENPPTSTS
jgi:hypothetical protein